MDKQGIANGVLTDIAATAKDQRENYNEEKDDEVACPVQ